MAKTHKEFSKNKGYVGIGTSSPSYPLHVIGNARFNFDATINGKLGICTTTHSVNFM